MTINYEDFQKEIYERCDAILNEVSQLINMADRIKFLTVELRALDKELRGKYNFKHQVLTEPTPEDVYDSNYNIEFLSEAEFKQWKKES
jgi:hypothetical protein